MVWTPRSQDDEPFHRQMRRATRDIHAVSDALVNGKLAFALSDDSVWADGLLVFYEVFRFLEEAIKRNKDKLVSNLFLEGLERTAAFEADLKFYYGDNWTSSYTPRESVATYLKHLIEIEKEDPDLLICYVYHLYMGLLSGGQILRKKRQIVDHFSASGNADEVKDGYAVTDFNSRSIYQLKKDLVSALNDVALKLDVAKKEKILEESRTVFELNNALIRSVKGADQVFLRKVFYCLAVLFCVYIVVYKVLSFHL